MSGRVLTHAQLARQAKLIQGHETTKVYGDRSQLTQDDNFVYLNFTKKNNTLTTEDVVARFQTTRSQAILTNPNDYLVAVERFKIPAEGIPQFVFKDDSTYELIMSYDGATVREFLTWVPTSVPQIARQWVFNFQHMLNIINATYVSVYNALKILKPAMPNDHPPFITYDSNSNLFKLFYDETWIAVDTAKFGMNDAIYQLFSFHSNAILFSLSNQNVDYYEFVAENVTNNYVVGTTPLYPNNANYFYSQQSYKTINAWSPVSRIIINSHDLPIRKELIASANSQSQGILTDFVPNHENSVDNLEYIFNASSDHRWHDMITTSEFRNTDISVTWEDYLGNVYIVPISFGREASLKLVFKQRGDIVTG